MSGSKMRFAVIVAFAVMWSTVGALPSNTQQPQQQPQSQIQRPLAAGEVIAVPILGLAPAEGRQSLLPVASVIPAYSNGKPAQRQPVSQIGRTLLATSASNYRPQIYAHHNPGFRPQMRGYNGGFNGSPRHSHKHFHQHIGGDGLSGAGGLVGYGGGGGGGRGQSSSSSSGAGFGYGDQRKKNQGYRGGSSSFGAGFLRDTPNPPRGQVYQQGRRPAAEDDVEYGDPDDVTLGDIGDVDFVPLLASQPAGRGGASSNSNEQQADSIIGAVAVDADVADDGGEADDDALDDAVIELDDVNKSLSENEILDVVTLFNERRNAFAAEEDLPSDELINEPPPRENKSQAATARVSEKLLTVVPEAAVARTIAEQRSSSQPSAVTSTQKQK